MTTFRKSDALRENSNSFKIFVIAAWDWAGWGNDVLVGVMCKWLSEFSAFRANT